MFQTLIRINQVSLNNCMVVMKQIGMTRDDCVIMGGDWNTILDPKLDR